MKEVVIVSATRTAIGSFGGGLKSVSAIELGSLVMKSVLKKAGLRPAVSEAMKKAAPDKLKDQGPVEIEKKGFDYDAGLAPVIVDECLMGCVLQAGQGQNPARQAQIHAGIPKETPATTVNKICGSGLKSIIVGAQSIALGQADVIIAGGLESMSNAPLALKKARWGHRMEITGVGEVHDLMVFDGLYEIFYGYHMGLTAENITKLYGIDRREQDELGLMSHQRARAAIKNGLFKEEITPVIMKSRGDENVFDTDERPMDTTIEKMAGMKPAFAKDGTVTAGNASGINDGAAAVLLMSAEKAREMKLEPLAKIKTYASGGVDPAYMGVGPVPAIRKTLDLAKMTIKDLEMIELNEAFAAQAIGCFRELGIDNDFPNQLGSGISLGHPIGCTGARMVVTTVHQMKRKGVGNSLISMCIGGGMGIAMILER